MRRRFGCRIRFSETRKKAGFTTYLFPMYTSGYFPMATCFTVLGKFCDCYFRSRVDLSLKYRTDDTNFFIQHYYLSLGSRSLWLVQWISNCIHWIVKNAHCALQAVSYFALRYLSWNINLKNNNGSILCLIDVCIYFFFARRLDHRWPSVSLET